MKFLNYLKPSMAFALFGLLTLSAQGQTDEKKSEKEEPENMRIRIVDRDGREINPQVIIRKQDSDQKKGETTIEVTNNNGTFTIRDADGNEKKIDAVSVMVSQAQQTTVVDGEEKTELVKKAIVVDRDGKTYEIDLSDNTGVEAGKVDGIFVVPSVVGKSAVGKYMVGVVAHPIAEGLAEQLKLDAGTGLVVQSVSPNTPAAKGGIKEGDVLLFANQVALKNLEDLTGVIQKAGEEKQPVSLVLVRDEKEQTIEVTPEERKMSAFGGMPMRMGAMNLDPEFQKALDNMANFDFDWAQAGPGVVFDAKDFDPEAIRAQVEKMREQLRLQTEEMKKAMKLVEPAPKPEAKADPQQMQKLLDEIKKLREELEELKKNKK